MAPSVAQLGEGFALSNVHYDGRREAWWRAGRQDLGKARKAGASIVVRQVHTVLLCLVRRALMVGLLQRRRVMKGLKDFRQ